MFSFVEIVQFWKFLANMDLHCNASSSENQVSEVRSAVNVVFVVQATCFK